LFSVSGEHIERVELGHYTWCAVVLELGADALYFFTLLFGVFWRAGGGLVAVDDVLAAADLQVFQVDGDGEAVHGCAALLLFAVTVGAGTELIRGR